MILVDAHEDLAYNYICFGRDYRQSVYTKRQQEMKQNYPSATLGLPEALQARVAFTFATLFAPPAMGGGMSVSWQEPMYHTPQEAHDINMRQLEYYHRLNDESDEITLVRNKDDFASVLHSWEIDEDDAAKPQQGLVVLMEGADAILEPQQFEEWYEWGVRIVGPAWSSTRYAGGTGDPGPLTSLGFELLEMMASFNVISRFEPYDR